MASFFGQLVAILSFAFSSYSMRQQASFFDIARDEDLGVSLSSRASGEKPKNGSPFERVGDDAGIWIWRIEDFNPVLVPKKDYGKFYTGDCYLVLQATKPRGDKLVYDIYFWIGSKSTQDEQGSVAHWAVELDDHFHGSPTQHREVDGKESSAFSKVFPRMEYLEGGVDSAFDPVDPERFKTKLFIVRKTKKHGLRIKEVPRSVDSLNQGDCFVLDGGVDIRTWCGPTCSPFEKFPAAMYAEKLESERGARRAKHTADNHGKEPSDEFWNLLGERGPIREDFEEELLKQAPLKVLYQLSHVNGNLNLKEVATGNLKKSMLVPDDVMLVDTGVQLFVWIGRGADAIERRNAMDTAVQYTKVNRMPAATPIHVFKDGSRIDNDDWNKMFSN